MITDVPGIRVGHATDEKNHTGCSVILCPPNTVGGVDVRGPAPGSRETELLKPEKHVSEVHAVLLTGGSAFGLAAADGVMRFLAEHDTGYWTPFARIPIVPAAVVYDLFMSGGHFMPDHNMGYQACLDAHNGEIAQGNVGAGAGVTIGKWRGFETMMKGGFGTASIKTEVDDPMQLVVAGVAVTNSVGDVVKADGTVLAGARTPEGLWWVDHFPQRSFPSELPAPPGTNTTLIVVATNASMTKVETNRLAQRAHDGLAIAVRPAHTTHDGDTSFALATNQVKAPFDFVANTAVEVVATAIRSAVFYAKSVGNVPGLASAKPER